MEPGFFPVLTSRWHCVVYSLMSSLLRWDALLPVNYRRLAVEL